MKLTIGLLIGATFVLASCLGLAAQDADIILDAPIAAPIPASYYLQDDVGLEWVTQAPLGGVTFSRFGGGGNLNSLNDPSVMKDLELVDDQKSQIADVRSDFNKRRKEVWKAMLEATNKNDKESLKETQERMADLQKEQEDALSDVLLPHQLDRIKQLARQIQMQRMGGASAAFQHGQLAQELDISDEQKKKLAEIQKKMHQDIAAKTKEIQSAAKKHALEQLTAEQKAKFNELTGEDFKRNPKDWQEQQQKRTYTRRRN